LRVGGAGESRSSIGTSISVSVLSYGGEEKEEERTVSEFLDCPPLECIKPSFLPYLHPSFTYPFQKLHTRLFNLLSDL
jgi:hypothetical protein